MDRADDMIPVALLTPNLRVTRRERRSRLRRSTDDPVLIFRNAEPDQPQSGWSLNISDTGIRVVLESRLDVGESIGIEVAPPMGKIHAGKVVWVNQRTDGCIAGICFA